ncbi:hypothetical protein DFH08DRAFT_963305 [Mycena albidolilacea]|uniref:Uncharacterized protein n=1 Tax=Mycena albidolilacea TaxID=1033008 RepID=A0AAD7EPE0_9AGAR|nr:hypothetical protein DFH08DRAFT_963305 [Mycena albidolilacea]
MPVAALNASGPISTVEDFTARQWMKYIDRQPLDVNPTFAVAPQSEYYGSVELPDGQILHRSAAANVLRIFRDRTTGRPYTIACHEFTFHLAAPNDPQKAWQLELCYPSDIRMKAAMAGMAPADALERGEVLFPKHATKEKPPMLPLFRRAKVDLELPENMLRVHAVRENEAMNERPDTVNPTLVLRPSAIKSEEKADLDVLADVQEHLKDESPGGNQEQFILRLECGSSCLVDSESSLPELEDVDSSSDTGTCPYCFDRQHASATECPLQGISEATASQLIGMTNDPTESDIGSSAYSVVSSSASTSSGTEDSVVDPLQKVPQYNPPLGEMAELHMALYYWAYDGALRQIDIRRYEDEQGSEPAELALRVVHGSLQRFIDYGAMATEEIQRPRAFAVRPPTPFRPLSPLPNFVANFSITPEGPLESSALFTPDASDSSGPNPTQSPTSLDFSLPSPLKAEPLPQEENFCEAELPEQEARAESSAMGQHSGSKRKAPDDQTGRRQRAFSKFAGESLRKSTVSRAAFKATGILDADVIRKFAGVRLATIETARRMEDIVWKLYGISEQSFPTELFRHPLLHEYELAKMLTVLDVLRRNGRSRMANNLHNLLAIRLRDDYAVSQLLNTRFLDTNYPEFGEEFHELLRDVNEVSVPPSGTIPDCFPVDERESGTDSEMPEYSDGEDYEESQGWDYFRVAHSV